MIKVHEVFMLLHYLNLATVIPVYSGVIRAIFIHGNCSKFADERYRSVIKIKDFKINQLDVPIQKLLLSQT